MNNRLITLTLILLLAGCATLTSQNSPSTSPSSDITTTAITLSDLPTSTVTANPTKNPTPTSIVPDLALTLTPLSIDGRVLHLFEYPVCNFPCWWAIYPGQTRWADAEKVFDLSGLTPSIFETNNENTTYEIIHYLSESIYFLNFRIYEKRGVVEFISINSFLQRQDFQRIYAPYEPKKIVEKYGNPSRVSLFTDHLNLPSYTLYFFYDQQGFLVTYGGKTKSTTESESTICPSIIGGSIEGAGMYFQSNEIKNPIEMYPGELGSFNIVEPYLRPINVAAGLTIDEFSNLLLRNETMCITVRD